MSLKNIRWEMPQMWKMKSLKPEVYDGFPKYRKQIIGDTNLGMCLAFY